MFDYVWSTRGYFGHPVGRWSGGYPAQQLWKPAVGSGRSAFLFMGIGRHPFWGLQFLGNLLNHAKIQPLGPDSEPVPVIQGSPDLKEWPSNSDDETERSMVMTSQIDLEPEKTAKHFSRSSPGAGRFFAHGVNGIRIPRLWTEPAIPTPRLADFLSSW